MAHISDQERHDATKLCIEAMEARRRLPPQAWEDLIARWGRDDLHPELLLEIVSQDLDQRGYRQNWYTWYTDFADRRQVVPLDSAARARVLDAMQAHQLGFIVYARILDCFPGGNASNRVLKFVLTTGGALRLYHYANLDGAAYHTIRPIRLSPRMGRDLRKRLCYTLRPLIAQAIEVSFDDPQTSPGAAGTEWSSIEVMAYAPRRVVDPSTRSGGVFSGKVDRAGGVDGWSLVSHLHQRALCRQWNPGYGEGDRDVPLAEASEEAQAVLDHAFTGLGLGFPDEFSLGEDDLSAEIKAAGGFWPHHAELPGFGMYTMPIYLRGD